MSKLIEATLLASKAQSSTTLCYLRKIGPLPDGTYRYQCSLDVDVEYDDGTGMATYKARIGYDPAALVSTSDLGVDNSEGQMLVPLLTHEGEGITRAQVDAGYLDRVPFVVYEIDYVAKTGHEIRNGGTLGEVKFKYNDTVLIPEERSLSQQLKQTIGEVDSLTCRARFGSQPIGTGDGSIEERFPCGFLLSAEWVEFTVEDVGAESDREFTDPALTQDADWFAPGVVEWLAGNNAGQKNEVETFASGAIGLQFPTVNPILLGDTGRIRRECTKLKSGHNSCKDTFWQTEWYKHFRGEPAIPVADTGKLGTPGAGINSVVTGGTTGTGEYVPPNIISPTPPSGGTGGTTTATTRTRGATVVTPTLTAGSSAAAANTAAINAAYASLPGDGGTVRIPAGLWYIDPNTSVKPLSYTLLDLETNNATLQETYTATDHKYGVLIDGKTNVEIAGGQIIGYRDAWSAISGTTSEWGHCIFVTNSSTAVTIRNCTLTKAVGDGVSIGYTCSDVWVDDCIINACRRQGVSTGGDAIKVTNCEISYIRGTAPASGIDVEPDSPAVATTTTITGNHIHNCAGPAVQAVVRSNTVNLSGNTLEYCSYGFYGSGSTTGTLGTNTIQHNKYQGVRLTSACSGYTLSGDTYFNNNTSVRGTTTTGSTTSRTGESSATADHILISSDSSATVGTNLFGP